jgi:hypothetical protein
MKRKKIHGIKRSGKEREYEGSSGEAPFPVETNDEINFDNANDEFPDSIPLRKKKEQVPDIDIYEDPEGDTINLIGDKNETSDAAMAIRALLGEGGDFRAASEIDDNQVRALLVLLDVAEELNSPRLLKTAENFLLLRISAGGKGRQQVVGAFKGLYEPNNNPQQDGQMPTGALRGVR